MKKILLILFLFAFVKSFGQTVPDNFYTPETWRVFKGTKADSIMRWPLLDTTNARYKVNGNVTVKSGVPYIYYNKWLPFFTDSLGVQRKLAGKVDSVTIFKNYLYYWIEGTSYGQQLGKVDSVKAHSDSLFYFIGGDSTFFYLAIPGSGGTVLDVSVGNLAPIFTASVANPTDHPAISFTISNAAANTFLGNNGSSTAAPSYSRVKDENLLLSDVITNNSNTSNHGFLKKLNNDATYFMNGVGDWAIPPGTGEVPLTFTNGLTRAVNTVKLGGTLIETTTENTGGFATTWTGANTNEVLTVTNTQSGYTALKANSNGGYAVYGASTNDGTGVLGVGNGAGAGGNFVTDHTSTNTTLTALRVGRQTTGTAANGIGVMLEMLAERSDGAFPIATSFESVLTNATAGAENSELNIRGKLTGGSSIVMNIQNGGIVRVNANADTLATKAYARSVSGGGGGGLGDMILADVQTVTGAKTFNDTKLLLRNVANTFNGSFVNTNTADRIYTLKDAAGTLAFTSDITGTNSGTNTGDVTLSAIGVTPNANGSTLTGQAFNLQPASASFGGVVTTGAQTLAGAKTWSNAAVFSSTINLSTLGGGTNSISLGKGTTDASGTLSLSFGHNITNNYDKTIVIGAAAQVNADSAISIGINTQANIENSIAIGNYAFANDAGAVAFGLRDTALYEGAAAFGTLAAARDDYSSAFGYGAKAKFGNATAIGSNSQAEVNATAIGYNAIAAANTVTLGTASESVVVPGPLGVIGAATFSSTIEGRWKARVGSTTSSATPTINTDNVDIYKLTAQSADITSFTTNLSGTPVDGDILEVQITGTAARAITWGASFVSSTVTLPATTVTTATLTVIFQYYTTSSYGNNKWTCVNYY